MKSDAVDTPEQAAIIYDEIRRKLQGTMIGKTNFTHRDVTTELSDIAQRVVDQWREQLNNSRPDYNFVGDIYEITHIKPHKHMPRTVWSVKGKVGDEEMGEMEVYRDQLRIIQAANHDVRFWWNAEEGEWSEIVPIPVIPGRIAKYGNRVRITQVLRQDGKWVRGIEPQDLRAGMIFLVPKRGEPFGADEVEIEKVITLDNVVDILVEGQWRKLASRTKDSCMILED